MKGKISLIALSFAIFSTLQSCNQNGNANKNELDGEHIKEIAHADYKCPMDCETGKVYHEAGKCPVCSMDLEKIQHTADEKHAHDTTASVDGSVHKDGEKHEHKDGDGHNH